MAKKVDRTGQHLLLFWDDSPDFEVVYGAVEPQQFLEAVNHSLGEHFTLEDFINIRMCYARWIPTKYSDYDLQIRLQANRAPGAFLVTVGDYKF